MSVLKAIDFPNLNGDNYASWSKRMVALLRSHGCHVAIDEPKEGAQTVEVTQKQKDDALALLTLKVEDHLLSTVADAANPCKAWSALRDLFNARSEG